MRFSDNPSGFVNIPALIPDAVLEIRYFTGDNFIGERIDGYEEEAALLTREAALALRQAAVRARENGCVLKIYDAYRPQAAVDHFMRWAEDPSDLRRKEAYYPDLAKEEIIPGGYIAGHSGHTRGSTVDLTLLDAETGEELDMGGTFDWFGDRSHTDFAGLSGEQAENRALLRRIMENSGFTGIREEWWHFTLAKEPYPDTYFTFPVNSALLPGEKD